MTMTAVAALTPARKKQILKVLFISLLLDLVRTRENQAARIGNAG